MEKQKMELLLEKARNTMSRLYCAYVKGEDISAIVDEIVALEDNIDELLMLGS